MIRKTSQQLALILFCIYLAVLPGSTIVVALDRVPRWGAWMGGALLLIQGAAALCWLLGRHGARGGLAALLVFLLAWAVEHAGVTTGMPFGRYHYTGALQPQLFGAVPLAIPCAWLMVAAGAWQLSSERWGDGAMGRWGEEQGSIHRWPTRPPAHRPLTICRPGGDAGAAARSPDRDGCDQDQSAIGSGAMAGHTTACRQPISWPGG